MGGERTCRLGFTLIETLVATTLSFALLTGGWVALERQVRMHAEVHRTVRESESTRMASSVLRTEIRNGIEGLDWSVHPPDSVTVRAFRGYRFVCRALFEDPTGAEVPVYGVGTRAPNADKDSVLVLHGDGRWRGHRLVRVRPSGSVCPTAPGRPLELWTLEPGAPRALVAQYFEKLSYHLASSAFRVRFGRGGRQPLTHPLFDTDRSGFHSISNGIGMELVLKPASGSAPEGASDRTEIRFIRSLHRSP